MPSKKRGSFAKGQKGTSGYLKPKGKTLRELDRMLGESDNDLDRTERAMEYEEEESKGITDHIRNIFAK